MDINRFEKALLPYEKKLRSQEKLRRLLGVKEVDRPTYERYITGSIERFDRRKNTFSIAMPDNSFGKDIFERMKKRVGDNSFGPLPAEKLPDTLDRISQSLSIASWRLCQEWYPQTLPVTPQQGRVEVTDKTWMSRLIKKTALFMGAEMVRITEIDPRWVYQDINISHKYAILVVVSHATGLNNTAPSHFSAAATAEVYSRLKFITTQLADFISGLGYDAAYRETLGGKAEMLIVPMAIDAGIGEFARNGRVLSPEFGINMRIKAVTTDLPLEPDKPISFGVHDFCMACESCATYCPSGAIPFGAPTDAPIDIYNNPGYRKWYVNAERCLTWWLSNKKKWTSCGRCISVCPWNKPLNFHYNILRWIAIHSPTHVKETLVSLDQKLNKRTKRLNK